MKNHKNIKKERFYKKMQNYIDTGLAREIYSSDDICMFNFGDVCYVACSYELMDGVPIGILMSPNLMKGIIEKNRRYYPLLMELLNDEKCHDLIFDFSLGVKKWSEWLDNEKRRGVSSVNYELEEEIKGMVNSKSR